ncbi:MAG: hypothetical protein CVU91_11325 [Firmicutes bacterium HGW-Firmicutes-16]|nr:MAG: hypothetical protein CVU91_11325 [Firmicutes bacterium HGW-Firmicutes-16]
MESFTNDWEPYDQTQVIVNNTKLWNPKSFIAISVFFSFLPAAILYSINYGRLGETRKRNIGLVVSFLSFVVGICLGFFIDSTFMKYVFYGLNVGFGIYIQNDQTKLYNAHIQSGGQKASYLIPVIICVSVSALLIFGFIFGTIRYSNIPDQKKEFSGDELYYTDNVNIDEVNKLGEYLEDNNVFSNDGDTWSFKLDKKDDTYIFSMIVSEENINNEEYLEAAKLLAQQLASDVFQSQVEIDACDNKFNPLKVITN